MGSERLVKFVTRMNKTLARFSLIPTSQGAHEHSPTQTHTYIPEYPGMIERSMDALYQKNEWALGDTYYKRKGMD